MQNYVINQLLNKWKERQRANSYYEIDEYSIALNECIQELQETINSSIAEEEYFNDMLKHYPSDTLKNDLSGELADKEYLVTIT